LPGPRLARKTSVFVSLNDAFDVAIAALEIHRDYGNRESKAKARFKWLVEKLGLRKILNMIEKKVGKTFESYEGLLFIKDGNHEGIQPQNQNPYQYINIPILGGRLTSNQISHIIKLSDDFGSGELRLTPTQNIIIPYVKETLKVSKRLKSIGLPIKGLNAKWSSMGCSSDFCGKSKSTHAKQITEEILEHLERLFDHSFLDEAGFRIHVSGCPHNCCANLISEIGLAGRMIREGDDRKQAYDILLGGGLGSKSAFGKVIEPKIPADEVKLRIESLFSNYNNFRDPSEKLGEFCNRQNPKDLRNYLNSYKDGVS
jgi:sulfite reductase beta subunit-like hemoprotein